MAYGNYAPFYRTGYFNPMQTPAMPTMAENQGQYVPQYQQPINQPLQNMQQFAPTNDMIWVLNLNEAESYPVALNNSVVLWDKSNPTIYIKSVNAQGIPSMRVLDFTERNTDISNSHEITLKTHECKCGDRFATKEQINDLQGKIDGLEEKIKELLSPVVEKPKTTTKKVKESEE